MRSYNTVRSNTSFEWFRDVSRQNRSNSRPGRLVPFFRPGHLIPLFGSSRPIFICVSLSAKIYFFNLLLYMKNIFDQIHIDIFFHISFKRLFAAPSSCHLDPLTISLSFFRESKALLASTIIFLEGTSCFVSLAKLIDRLKRKLFNHNKMLI